MSERQKFYFVSELDGLEFVGVYRNVGEDVESHFIPAADVERFVEPLLNFKSDPRRQYWVMDFANNRLEYLGEFADFEDAEVSLGNHHNRDPNRCVVLNAYRAMHLLHSLGNV